MVFQEKLFKESPGIYKVSDEYSIQTTKLCCFVMSQWGNHQVRMHVREERRSDQRGTPIF